MDWDLASFFERPESRGYDEFKKEYALDLAAFQETLEEAPPLRPNTIDTWAQFIGQYEHLIERTSHLAAYIGCLTSADAANEAYSADEAWLADLGAARKKIANRLIGVLGRAEEASLGAILDHPALEDAGFAINEMRDEAARRMSDPEEALAAELSVTGMAAWSRLYFTLVGKLKFRMQTPDGEERVVPYAQRMTLITDPDRSVRQAAFEGANEALAAHETTLGSALNAIAGERLTLLRRRQVPHFLDEACRQARITRSTLEALMSAIDERKELSREILRFRMDKNGIKSPAFYDVYAPLQSDDNRKYSWEEAVELVEGSFCSAYPDLGAFFRRIVDRRWIDHSPRENKRPGGFCTTSQLIRESRIFMTFQGTMDAIMTLAHETGHAWHNCKLQDRRTFAADYPMTLAESASTFAEMILSEGIVEDPAFPDAQKRSLLDSDTERVSAFLLDIPMRFHFERAFYEERSAGPLPISRIKELMRETQRRMFGDTVSEGGEDPYFWASKLHFYIDDISFYNFPYAFGYLLSLALFSRFRSEGRSFLPGYERFLAETGMKTCEAVIRDNLGEDITDREFWTRAIDEVKRPYDRLRAQL